MKFFWRVGTLLVILVAGGCSGADTREKEIAIAVALTQTAAAQQTSVAQTTSVATAPSGETAPAVAPSESPASGPTAGVTSGAVTDSAPTAAPLATVVLPTIESPPPPSTGNPTASAFGQLVVSFDPAVEPPSSTVLYAVDVNTGDHISMEVPPTAAGTSFPIALPVGRYQVYGRSAQAEDLAYFGAWEAAGGLKSWDVGHRTVVQGVVLKAPTAPCEPGFALPPSPDGRFAATASEMYQTWFRCVSPEGGSTTSPPVIDTFTVEAAPSAQGGRRLTFRWETTGATAVRLLSGTSQRFPPAWELGPDGTHAVELTDTVVPNPTLVLIAQNAAGQETQQQATVEWPCRYPDAFAGIGMPHNCPFFEATRAQAAEQSFERGFMIWLQELAYPSGPTTGVVYVFYDDGRWQRFEDTFEEGAPESDETLTPPAGLMQPIRGFGKVWREQAGVRDTLGWALAKESGFDGLWQAETRESIPAVARLRRLDGRTVKLYGSESGTWAYGQ